MNKKIKPSALSTAFFKNGTSVKKRLENILNTRARKKRAVIFVLALCVMAAGILIVGNNGRNVGIIGGSDGPTAIFVSRDTHPTPKN